MNMISTGAFLNEMDASIAQPTVAEKFAAVWEKKNAKAARAGGVSLMALSLAACGSSSTTTSSTTTTTTTTTTATGQSLTLTSSVDAITGGAGDDTITAARVNEGGVATVQTLGATDSIDGGAGTDTLTVELDTATTPLSISNVEHIKLTSVGALTHNLANVTGMTELSVIGNTGATVLNNMAAIPTVNVTNNAQNLDLDYVAAAVTGTTTAQTLNVNTMTAGTITLDAGVELLTINSSGNVTNVTTLTATGLTKITATGSAKLDIDGASVADTVLTVDASGTTGGFLMMGTTGDVNMTITGGSGADTIDMVDEYEITDVIDGGAGADVLRSDSADFEAVVAALTDAKLKNIETIYGDDQGAASINLTYFNGASTLKLAGNDGAGDTFTFASGNTFHLTADVADGVGNASTTIRVGGNGTSDTLTLKMDSGVDILENNVALAITGVETLTIEGPSTAGTKNDFAGAVTMTASAGGSTKMVLTGANEIEFSGAVTAGTLDASALTGELDMTTASGGAMTILGGTAADDIFGSDAADSITGGAGADEIDAGGGVDTVAGGAGADDFILNADGDLGDTITDFVSGTDDIDYNITLVDDNGNTSVTAGNLTAAMYVDVTGGANATTITGNGDAVIFEFSNAADYLGAGNTVTFDLTTATAAEIKAEVIDQLTTDASVALTDGAISTTELLFIMYDESGNAALIQFDEEDSTAPTTIDTADGIVVAAILTGIEAGGLAVGDII